MRSRANPQQPHKHMTSTTPTIQSASLHFREGNSDKEYHAAIEPSGEGYIVTFAYGRRGNHRPRERKPPLWQFSGGTGVQ